MARGPPCRIPGRVSLRRNIIGVVMLLLLLVHGAATAVTTESVTYTSTGSASEEWSSTGSVSESRGTISSSLSSDGPTSSATLSDSAGTVTDSLSEERSSTASGASHTITEDGTETISHSLAATLSSSVTFSGSVSEDRSTSVSASSHRTISESPSGELTMTITVTPPPTPSATFSMSVSDFATESPTDSRTPPETRTATVSESRTPPPTPTPQATHSASEDSTMSASESAEATLSATTTEDGTGSESVTVSDRTDSNGVTLTETVPMTETASHAASVTTTEDATVSISGSHSITEDRTESASVTLHGSASATQTNEATLSESSTITASEDATQTGSESLTNSRPYLSLTEEITMSHSHTSTMSASLTGSSTLSFSDDVSQSATVSLHGTVTASGATPSASPSSESTSTLSVAATSSATATASASNSQTDDETASATLPHTASPSWTASAEATASQTVPLTETPGPTFTALVTSTPSVSQSDESSVSESVSSSASDHGTVSSSLPLTPSPTDSRTPPLSATPSLVVSDSISVSASTSASLSDETSLSASLPMSSTPTLSASDEQTLSVSMSLTASLSSSFSPSDAPTDTPTPSATPPLTTSTSASVSLSTSEEATATRTPTITPPPTRTPTSSRSATQSASMSYSASTSATGAASMTESSSLSLSASVSITDWTPSSSNLPTDTFTFVPTLTSRLTSTPTITLSISGMATSSASGSGSHDATVSFNSASGSVTELRTMSESKSPTQTFGTRSTSVTSEVSASHSISMSEEQSQSHTISPPPTPSHSFTKTVVPPPTPSVSPSDEATASESQNVTLTLSLAPSASATITDSVTEQLTSSETESVTSTESAATVTNDETASTSQTGEMTPSESVTRTLALTETETLPETPSLTVTHTITPPPTPTPTATFTDHETVSESVSGSSSVSATITPPPTPTRSLSSDVTSTETVTAATLSHPATETIHSFTTTQSMTVLPTRTPSFSDSRPTLMLIFPRFNPQGGRDPFGDPSAPAPPASNSEVDRLPQLFGNAIRNGGASEFRRIVIGAAGDLFALQAASRHPDGPGAYFLPLISVDATRAPTLSSRRWRVLTAESISVNASLMSITFAPDSAFDVKSAEIFTIRIDRRALAQGVEPVVATFRVAILPTSVAAPDPFAPTPVPGSVTRPPQPNATVADAVFGATEGVVGTAVAASSATLVGLATAQHLSRSVAQLSIARCAGVFTEMGILEHPTQLSIRLSDEPNADQVAHFVGALIMNLAIAAVVILAHFVIAALYLVHKRNMLAAEATTVDDSVSNRGNGTSMLARTLAGAMKALQFPSKALFVLILYPACIKAATALFFFSKDASTLSVAFATTIPWVLGAILAVYVLTGPLFSAKFVKRRSGAAGQGVAAATVKTAHWSAASPAFAAGHNRRRAFAPHDPEGIVIGPDFDDTELGASAGFDGFDGLADEYQSTARGTSLASATKPRAVVPGTDNDAADDAGRSLAHVAFRRYFLPRGEWVDLEPPRVLGFAARFGGLFDDYRGHHQHFFIPDLLASTLLGGADGYAVATRHCNGSAILVLVVLVAFLLVMVWRRPYNARMNNLFFIVIVAIQVVLAALAVRSTAAPDDDEAFAALEGCSLWLQYLLLIRTALDLCVWVYETCCESESGGTDGGRNGPVGKLIVVTSAPSLVGSRAPSDALRDVTGGTLRAHSAASSAGSPVGLAPRLVVTDSLGNDTHRYGFGAAPAAAANPSRFFDAHSSAFALPTLAHHNAAHLGAEMQQQPPPTAHLLRVPTRTFSPERVVESEHFALGVRPDDGRAASSQREASPQTASPRTAMPPLPLQGDIAARWELSPPGERASAPLQTSPIAIGWGSADLAATIDLQQPAWSPSPDRSKQSVFTFDDLL